MKTMVRLSVFFTLALCASAGFAQSTVGTLEWCINYALEHNLAVQNQDISEDIRQNSFDQAKLTRLPSLNASASHNYNFGRTIDPFTNQFINNSIQSNNFSLTSSVTVFNGKRITNSILQAENNVEQARLQGQLTRNQIALQVADAYLQVIFAQNQWNNLIEINKSTKAQLERAKALYEAGTTNQQQYLSFKAQDARDQMNIQSAQGNFNMAYLRLKQLMMYTGEDFELNLPNVDEVPYQEEWRAEAVLNNALATMPDMQLAKKQVQSAELNTQISKSALYPRLNLFANVNTLYSETRLETFNPTLQTREIGYVEGSQSKVLTEFTSYETKVASFGKQVDDNFGQALGFSLSVPIFNGNQARTAVSNAELNTKVLENNLENTNIQMRATIFQAVTDYQNAVAAYQSALANIAAQKENYDFAKKSSDAGVMSIPEYLLALNAYNSAKIDLERAKFQVLYANTVLKFYNTGEVSL